MQKNSEEITEMNKNNKANDENRILISDDDKSSMFVKLFLHCSLECTGDGHCFIWSAIDVLNNRNEDNMIGKQRKYKKHDLSEMKDLRLILQENYNSTLDNAMATEEEKHCIENVYVINDEGEKRANWIEMLPGTTALAKFMKNPIVTFFFRNSVFGFYFVDESGTLVSDYSLNDLRTKIIDGGIEAIVLNENHYQALSFDAAKKRMFFNGFAKLFISQTYKTTKGDIFKENKGTHEEFIMKKGTLSNAISSLMSSTEKKEFLDRINKIDENVLNLDDILHTILEDAFKRAEELNIDKNFDISEILFENERPKRPYFASFSENQSRLELNYDIAEKKKIYPEINMLLEDSENKTVYEETAMEHHDIKISDEEASYDLYELMKNGKIKSFDELEECMNKYAEKAIGLAIIKITLDDLDASYASHNGEKIHITKKFEIPNWLLECVFKNYFNCCIENYFAECNFEKGRNMYKFRLSYKDKNIGNQWVDDLIIEALNQYEIDPIHIAKYIALLDIKDKGGNYSSEGPDYSYNIFYRIYMKNDAYISKCDEKSLCVLLLVLLGKGIIDYRIKSHFEMFLKNFDPTMDEIANAFVNSLKEPLKDEFENEFEDGEYENWMIEDSIDNDPSTWLNKTFMVGVQKLNKEFFFPIAFAITNVINLDPDRMSKALYSCFDNTDYLESDCRYSFELLPQPRPKYVFSFDKNKVECILNVICKLSDEQKSIAIEALYKTGVLIPSSSGKKKLDNDLIINITKRCKMFGLNLNDDKKINGYHEEEKEKNDKDRTVEEEKFLLDKIKSALSKSSNSGIPKFEKNRFINWKCKEPDSNE